MTGCLVDTLNTGGGVRFILALEIIPNIPYPNKVQTFFEVLLVLDSRAVSNSSIDMD